MLMFWHFGNFMVKLFELVNGVIEKETCKLLKNKHNDIFCVRR